MKKVTLIASAALIAVASTAVIATAKGIPGGNGHGQGNHIERLFERMDADQDGSITKAEVEAAAVARFTEADANGDGLLDADEMAAAGEGRNAERRAKRIAKHMERADTDGDGAISLEEMTASGGNRMDRMFENLDADGDGVITQAEAEAAKPMRRGGNRGHGHGSKNDE